MKKVLSGIKIVAGSYTDWRAFQGPFFVQMDVTHACNLRCLFCNTQHPKPWHHAIDFGVFMDYELFKSITRDMGRLGLRALTFTGTGEPTLHGRFPEMVAFAADLGIKTSVNTNGVMDQEKTVALIDAGIGKINISLNAATSETYSKVSGTESEKPFHKALSAIETIAGYRRGNRRRRIPLRLSFVLTSINYHEIVEMMQLAAKFRAEEVLYIIAAEMDRMEETRYLMITGAERQRHACELLASASALGKRHGIRSNARQLAMQGEKTGFHREGKDAVYGTLPCFVGWYFANITAAGLVLPCCQCSEPMGDLKKNTFREIWFSRRYADFRKSYKVNPLKPMEGVFPCEGCTDCSFIHYNTLFYEVSRPWKRIARRFSDAAV